MNLTFSAIADMPMIEPGDDLVKIIGQALSGMKETLQEDDVLVIAQ